MSESCSLVKAAWWVRVPVGILLLTPIFIFTVGSLSIFTIETPIGMHPYWTYVLGGSLVCVCASLLLMNIKMMLGISPAPNGFSPITLRVGGILLFIMPISGFVTGYYEQVGFAALPQALFFLWCSFSLFRLANKKSVTATEVQDEIA